MYPIGMMPFYGGMYAGNSHQMLKSRYGVGQSDFGHSPYVQSFPMPYIQRNITELEKGGAIRRFIKKYFT